ncbi:MAG: glycosyltransferase [Pelagibacteraceae bacterium]|nr:glycosyltransferase [Pelagibacteraceae bacterium]MCI5078990.1 glycosyltransferase [Pelagibacteraceae bacterium]
MKKYIILIPVFNDWQSVFKLIENIDLQINNQTIDIVIVNDASTESFDNNQKQFSKINSVKIINLIKNGGHRKAIATGLKYCQENLEYDYIIPMDGDGEDRPEELKDFFNQVQETQPEVITATRVKRSEGFLFKFLYSIHKIFTHLITGKLIKFGNYTCLSKNAVSKLLSDGSVWLSFSGAVTKHFTQFSTIQSIRGERYFGPSKMSILALLLHSFRISTVFRENIFIRVVIVILIFGLLAYYSSAYFLIPSLAGWIFLFFIICLALDDDIKKLNNCLNNIKSLSDIYSR